MSDVKRYEAVHIRYEDSNIRYGEGCEVEVVAAYDYDALKAVNGELLEALEIIVGEADGYTARTGKPVYDWLDQARAAIAKARGEV